MTFSKKGEKAVSARIKRVILLVMAAVFFMSATAFATPPVMYNVTIYDGDNAVSVMTAETDAEQILVNEGITVSEAYGDKVSFVNFTGKDGSAIIIRRGVKVTIKNFDGTTHTVHTSGTVADALKIAGIALTKGTALNCEATDLLVDGMVIEIYDIYDVTIKVDGKEISKMISGDTVADALQQAGVKLAEKDYTEPALNTVLKDGLVVEVFRVKVASRTEKEDIDFETKSLNTDTLYKGEKKTVTQGIKGAKAIVYEDRFVNGELVESKVVSEQILTQPTHELIHVGTKEKQKPVQAPQSTSKPNTSANTTYTPGATPNWSSDLPVGTPMSELPVPSYVTIGSNGLPTNYKRAINAKATAYCEPGGPTSTGKRAQNGYIAVDPKEIPYGTEMYIVSADGMYVYGYCIAADTGGFIHSVDNTVDLHMNTEEQCRKWGRRDIVIFFL